MPKKTSRTRVAKKKTERLSLMQRFGLFFYDRRELTFLYLTALVVLGVLSYTVFMQRQGFPGVDVPISTVTGTYFVSDPERVDADVARPVAETAGEMPEVEAVTTQAGDNFFAVTVRYIEGVSSSRGNELLQATLKEQRVLPEAARAEFKPINATKYANEYDLLVSVYRPNPTDLTQLMQTADQVAAELENRSGVSRATVLRQLETGTDPRTGRTASEKRQFDRFGIREGGTFTVHPSVTIGIVGEGDQDALKLSEEVHTALGQIRAIPGYEDVRLAVSADFAEGISDQLDGLEQSLLEGLLAVLVVCFLLISWRASLTAAITMLAVMSITIGVLHVTGNTLNTITLFALILSLGLIVDDTIIKVEAIDAAKAESRRKRDIVAIAAKRVSLASLAGTLTTMLAFAPMLFIGGILGDFIRILPITVIIGLALSLLLSLVLVPLLADYIILRRAPRRSRNPVLKLESLISGGLSRLVLVSKRSRVKGALIGLGAVGIAAAMIVASVPLFSRLQFDIFPTTKDANQIQVAMTFPNGTSIAQAERVAAEVNDRTVRVLGDDLERLTYRNTGSAMQAVAFIDLKDFEQRDVTAPQLIERLNSEFAGFVRARIQVSQIDVGPPEDQLPFRAQVFSEDPTAATALAKDIERFLTDRTLTRQNGTTAKITRVEIANQSQITRDDGRRVVEVRAGFDAKDTSALVLVTQEDVEAEFPAERVQDYGLSQDALQFDFGAETENQESFSTLLIAFPILLVVMYVLMAFQFRSLLQPLLIFMAIPFSFFGVALGLYLTDNPLSFFVMIGFFALIGIAVNNTILLTDYANQARKDGQGRIDSIAYAIRVRFRPLITTSLTSIVALIPLALSDPFWESLSVTLMFGLLSSTFLVVIAFPYIYLAGEALRVFGCKWWTRQLPVPVQYPLDLVLAPVRLIRHQLYLIFRHKYD